MKNEFENRSSWDKNILMIDVVFINRFFELKRTQFLLVHLLLSRIFRSKVLFVFGLLFFAGFQLNAQSRLDKSGNQTLVNKDKLGLPGMESAKVPSGIDFPSSLEKVYGDINYELGEEVDSYGYLIHYYAEDSTILKIQGNVAMILKVGETRVFAELSELKHISNVVPLIQELKIHPGSLKINVLPDQKKTFGELDPDFRFEISGFVYGEGFEVVSGSLVREVGENAGKYRINQGNFNPGKNYQIEYSGADFEISKRELIVQAKSVEKYFGTVDPELSYEIKGVDPEGMDQLVTGQIKRQAGEKIGVYEIEVGDLKVANNYLLTFQEANFEIKSTELTAIFDTEIIETAWSVMPEFPSQVRVLTIDGQILEMPVSWSKSDLNLLEKGNHAVTGVIGLREGVVNPQLLKPVQKLKVLAKPSPKNVSLSQTKFEPVSTLATLEIGRFKVEDELDTTHSISLVKGKLDNSQFEITGSSLYWKSSSNSNVKNHYSISVQVLDRAGNTLEKEFKLTTEFSHISKIHVYNVFTPNNDGFNDTWGIPTTSEGIQIRVFNKNGNLLFETENTEVKWDGTYQGKSLPADTYFWMISSKLTGESRKGFLTLLL